MAACAEVISPLTFYGAPKSQLYAVLSCKNYFPPPFSFLGSLPASIASAPEQLSPEQAPPVRPTGSGQRALAPPHRGGRGNSRLSCPGHPRQPRGPGGGSGSGSQLPRRSRCGPVTRSNSSPARRGKGRTCISPGHSFLQHGEGASGGAAGLLCSAAPAGRGGECWGMVKGTTKHRPQSARSKEAVVLPSPTACPYMPFPHRWKTPNLGGKLRYSRH